MTSVQKQPSQKKSKKVADTSKVSKTKQEAKPVKKAQKVASETPKQEVNPQVVAGNNTVVTEVNEPVVTIETSLTEVLSDFAENVQTLTASLNKLKAEFKVLEKRVIREARSMDKVNAKRNKNKGSRAPSGFVKPAAISGELAKFLGVPEETQMARTDVTKMITSYVKEHNLQDSSNGRKILPDTKLKTLLKIKDGEEVTYFNLQKYMKPHFLKA
jgi:chromatin remodeling complex protein RSC6